MKQHLPFLRIIALSIFVFLTLSSYAANRQYNGYSVDYQQVRDNESIITFDLGKFNIDEVQLNGSVYSSIRFSNDIRTNLKGWASMPVISTSIQLPADRNVTLLVEEGDYIEYHLDAPLVPSRGIIYRNQDPSTIPYETDPASIVNEWYPANLVDNTDPYILRDVRGENLFVHPFRYNAVQRILRVYPNIQIRVVENESYPVNVLTRSGSIVKDMSPIYKSIFINYNQNPSRWTEEIGQFGEILVIYTSRDATAIQPWITWKKEMGYTVHEEQVSTNTNVKSNIAAAYASNPNILYVQLVGDWADIKSDLGTSQNSPMDPMMGCVAGSDDYHDIIIGRFSASTTAHVTIQGDKSIGYERDPDLGATWYTNGLGIGSNEGAGSGDDGEMDQDHIEIIKVNKLVPFTYSGTVTPAYGGSVATSTVANAINNGVSVINYCGHGGHDYWVTSNYSTSSANSSTNGTKLPVAFSVACVVGEFHTGSDCLAEAMLRKSGGGAVATWMATLNQPWQPPMRGQDYANDLLIQGYNYNSNPGSGTSTTYGKTTFGSITYNAAALMISESSGTDDWDTYKTWTVFGDASLQVRTDVPKDLALSNPSVNPGSYTTQVTVAGQPFENALVSLYKAGDPQPFSGLTDASGNVTINHSLTGTVKLTVTGFNLATYQAEAVVAVPNPPVADFVADQTVITAGGTINFTDLSTNYPSTWSWSFAGGIPATSTVQNPAVVYNTPGTYDVTLVATNPAGTDTETKVGYITVNAVSTPPVADFVASTTNIVVGGSVDFTDLSTNLPNAWSWIFDGGTPGTSTLQNPTGIVYDAAGTYSVTLTASNAFGSDDEVKTLYIVVDPPAYCDAAADQEYEYISSVASGDINNTTTWSAGGYGDFTDMTTQMAKGTSYTIDVSIGSVWATDQVLAWIDWNLDGDFDDAGEDVYVSPNLNMASHSFTVTPPNDGGVGNTRLRIRLHDTDNQYSPNATPCGNSGYGEVEDYTLIITGTSAVLPVASFTPAATVFCQGSTIAFTNQSTDADTYSWTFGGGTPSVSTLQNPSVDFTTPGTYTVELTANNSDGSDTYSVNIEVTEPANLGAITGDINCFNANDGSIDLTVTDGTSPFTYSWSNSATTEDLSMVSAGTYSVTVMDAAGCSAVTSATVSEPAALAVTASQVDESVYGAGDGSATVVASGGVPSYTYVWSNGQTAATATGLVSGTYTVTVVDANGCEEISTFSISFLESVVELEDNFAFDLYPNPNMGSFSLELSGFAGTDASVVVINAIGKEVYSGALNRNMTAVHMSDVSAGLYFVRVTGGSKTLIKKMIIK